MDSRSGVDKNTASSNQNQVQPDDQAELLEQAETTYQSVVEAKTPQEAVEICTKSISLFQKLQEIAVDNQEMSQKVQSGLAKAYSQRGHQYRYARNYIEAIKDLGQALELDPALSDDFYYRALSFLKIGNQAGAKRDFSEYIKRGDDEYLKRAAWERRESLMPKKDEAVASLEQWRNQGTHFNGEASNALHPQGEGEPDYPAAIALYNKAIEAFDQALELAPTDKLTKIYKLSALKGQAQCYSHIAEYDLAIADYNQIIQMQSTAQHIFERGELYRSAGQNELARADFEQFLKSGPGISVASRQQAQLYLSEKITSKNNEA